MFVSELNYFGLPKDLEFATMLNGNPGKKRLHMLYPIATRFDMAQWTINIRQKETHCNSGPRVCNTVEGIVAWNIALYSSASMI